MTEYKIEYSEDTKVLRREVRYWKGVSYILEFMIFGFILWILGLSI